MAAHPMDPSAMQTYTQNYLYDAVGNILQLQHIGATVGSYTRNYAYGSGNSKLNSTQIGATNYPYTYDSRGNMITMPHLSTMDWNGLNELQHTDNGTVETYFNYSGGQRIRKVCLKAGGIEEHRIYLGSYEIYRKFVSSSLTQERLTVHVSDDMGRIAMVETETTPTPATRIRYIYSNHLQSATLELDDSCAIISYEEYHPLGTTAFQSSDAAINAVAKRYRYTGKERDEETGLYYHGARYYIPWIGRWSACDPLEAKYAGMSPYNYSMNNPVMMNDPSGMGAEGVNQPIQYSRDKKGNIHGEIGEVVIKPNSAQPRPEPIEIMPSRSQNAVDNTQNRMFQLTPEISANIDAYQKAKTLEAARREAYWNQQFIGTDANGNYYSVTREGLAIQEHQQNEAWGEAIRGGILGSMGSHIGGKEMAIRWSALDQVAMSFSGAGTPFGKVESHQPTTKEYIPNTELSVAGPSILPNEVASTFMGGKYTSRYLEQDAFIYRSGDAEVPFGRFFSPTRPQGVPSSP